MPTEKFWKVENTLTKKVEPTTAELRTVLNLIELKRKSPFWTYTGLTFFIITFLFLIGYSFSGVIGNGIDSLKESYENKKYISQTANLVNEPKINDLYHIEMVELTLLSKKKLKKGIKKYFEYNVISFSNDSLELKLKENRYSSNKINLKERIKLAKKDLIKSIENFEMLNIYEKKQEFKDTNAFFKLDEIQR